MSTLQRLQQLDRRVLGEPRHLRPPAVSGPSVLGRAALALLLLVGYYVLVVLVLGGLVRVTLSAFEGGSGAVGGKLAVFTGLVALALGRAVFAVERRGAAQELGVPVTREQEPGLWRLVDEVAAETGFAGPDDLWLVEDVNAFVRQDTRLLGLLGGRRHLHLGTALLQVLTVDELRGVVAHELGHYGGGDTRLSAPLYRASATLDRTLEQLGPESLLGRLFGLYGRLFQRVSLAVRRRQELAADAASVRVVGRAAHASALSRVQAAAPAWAFYVDDYVGPLWESGRAPRDLFAGWRALLADPVRQAQLREVAEQDDGPADPYDSHPSLSERLSHVAALPDRQPPGDERPARALLQDPEQAERRVADRLNAEVVGDAAAPVDAFAGEPDAAPYVARLDGAVAALSRCTAAVDGGPAPAGLGRTLALLEQGRDDALVERLTGDRRDLGPEARQHDLEQLVTDALAAAAAVLLVRAGAARWRFSWSRSAELLDRRGEPLDPSALLGAALERSGPAGLRPVLERLGTPLEDEAVPEGAAEPEDGVVEVWPELRRGRRWFDAVVTPDLLVVVPQPRSLRANLLRGFSAQYGFGKQRRRRDAAARIDALLAEPVAALASRPGVHVLHWDAVGQVQLRRGLANAWVLRVPGAPRPLDQLKADDLLAPPPEEVAALLGRLVGDRLETNA